MIAHDTMHILGRTSEYEYARLWITDPLSFDLSGLLNAFEVTIRVLGGLLFAYYLSLDPLFLDKAVDLADCANGNTLIPIFIQYDVHPSFLPGVGLLQSKDSLPDRKWPVHPLHCSIGLSR